jgi:hypothetical protein
LVDGFRAPKIIGVDDQAALCGAITHAAAKLSSVHPYGSSPLTRAA